LIMVKLRLRPIKLATFGSSLVPVLGPELETIKKQGKPVIPGSSLKGALRSAASRVAETYGFKSCGEARPSALCSCEVCALFGKPGGNPGPLMADDLEPEGEVSKLVVTRVGISDDSGKAKEGSLYTTEHVYQAEFSGRLRIIRQVERKLLGLLLLSLAELRTGRMGRNTLCDLKLEETQTFRSELEERWSPLLQELERWLWEGKI